MMAVELREYQRAAIQAARDKVSSGRVAPLLVAPTGAGKTIIEAAIAKAHVDINVAHRVLLTAHRRELVIQAATTMRRMGLDVGEIHPAAEPRPDAPIQIASTQTLLARGTFPQGITLVLFDEAHHYSADDWSLLTKAYPDALRMGFTATPCRSDGRGLSPAFDSLVVVSTIKELTALGYLVPCKVIAPDKALRSGALASKPVDAYLEHCVGRKTVVFARYVDEAYKFADDFGARGVRAAVVHGGLSDRERGAALDEHRTKGAVLINVQVLTEGWDSPATSACILARGCGSVGTYLQIVGRVLRPSKGKEDAVLVDLSGRAFHAHGPPDEDRIYSLTGKGIRGRDGDELFCQMCGALVDEWPCAECGYEPSHAHTPLQYTGDELAERYAAKRAEDAERQTMTLARWFSEAKARGWKEWSAVAKFRHVYGFDAPRAVQLEARELAKTLACVQCTRCQKAVAKTYKSGLCGKCRFGDERGAA